MRPRAPHDAGFTLIELLVVLAILGLVLAVVVPRLDTGGETVALRAGAAELRAVLRAARSAAITANRDLLFAIDEGGRGYTFDGIHHVFRASALTVEPAAHILFFASGGASGGRLAIRGRRGEQALEIDSVTGQVTVAR
jgi:general secretion pathway protein H